MPNIPNPHIHISMSTIMKTILVLISLYVLYLIKDIALVVLTAVVLASAAEPATLFFMRQKLPRVFSVVLVYVISIGILLGSFYTIVPLLLEDTSTFLKSVPKYVDSVSLWSPIEKSEVANTKAVAMEFSQGIEQSQQAVGSGNGASVATIIEDINNTLSNASAGFVKTLSSVFGGVFSLILIIVLSFYLSVQEDGVEKFLRIITPLNEEKAVIDLWRRTQKKIGLWMQGQMVLALLIGVLVYLGLMVIGVKNALLFAALAALLETIPLFGPIIAAIPAVATAWNDGGASIGFITAGFYLIIHQFENHLVYPLVVTKIVGVPPILVILALIIGFKLAGFLGIILSVPIATFVVELMDDVQKRKTAYIK
jgi:predicted PurR-regulated permease PerM